VVHHLFDYLLQVNYTEKKKTIIVYFIELITHETVDGITWSTISDLFSVTLDK
jgi:hypothetical protein